MVSMNDFAARVLKAILGCCDFPVEFRVLRLPGKINIGIGDFEFPNSKMSDLGKSDSPVAPQRQNTGKW